MILMILLVSTALGQEPDSSFEFKNYSPEEVAEILNFNAVDPVKATDVSYSKRMQRVYKLYAVSTLRYNKL